MGKELGIAEKLFKGLNPSDSSDFPLSPASEFIDLEGEL